MPRKLSQIPATDIGKVPIRGYTPEGKPILQAYGLRAYDALAYDKVSASPCTGTRKESVLSERPAYINPDTHAGAKVCHPYNRMAVEHVLAGGVHPTYNYSAYLEANSIDHILLPTAANDLCFKCGLTVHCQCHKFDRHGRKV